jgi:hypothetical protein
LVQIHEQFQNSVGFDVRAGRKIGDDAGNDDDDEDDDDDDDDPSAAKPEKTTVSRRQVAPANV